MPFKFKLKMIFIINWLTIGDIMPVMIVIIDEMPIKIPEKFGVLSIMLASTPVVTAPWNESESVRKITAWTTLHPAYANPKHTNPLSTTSIE